MVSEKRRLCKICGEPMKLEVYKGNVTSEVLKHPQDTKKMILKNTYICKNGHVE